METTVAVTHEEPNYLAVFGWLSILTVIEIAVVFMPIQRYVIATALVGLAISKASIVAMYFMHLKFERKVLWFIAVVPAVLCLFLILMMLPELP
jgi:cytochrome c oxidase subunit 4